MQNKVFCYHFCLILIGNAFSCQDVEIVPGFGSSDSWSVRSPKNKLPSISTPVKHMIIAHTVTPECHSKETCSDRMRSMQNYHMDNLGWPNIGYNFVIGGDGRVYEGTGWTLQGIHTYGWNNKSYGIAFIGNFMKIKPTGYMLRAARKLIICGIKMGVISEDRLLHGARDATCTDSPGNYLYEIIKTWPRFQGGRLPGYKCYVN